ncbi:MAG: hypothetical protein AAFV74_02890 [Pseudomonadota bacterium]
MLPFDLPWRVLCTNEHSVFRLGRDARKIAVSTWSANRGFVTRVDDLT